MEFNMTFRTRRSSFSNRRRANSGIPGYDNQGWDAFGHPASYAQPEVDEYGIDSDFGEGVRKGPYLSGPPPASVGWMPNHPAVDQDLVEDYETGSQLHELNLKQAMERKASKCIQLAEKKLGRKASARAIENLALSYMNLSNSAIQRKLASSFLAEDEMDMMSEDMFAEDVVQEGTGYFGEVDAEDMMSDEFEMMSDELDMMSDDFEMDDMSMMAEMDLMARRANRSRFAGKKSEDATEAEQLAEEAVETAEQLAEEVEELKAELQAMKKANLRLRQAKKSEDAEELAEEAVETAEQLAEEVETLSEEVETLSEELKQAKKANLRLRMAKKSEDSEELSDSEVLEEEIKALKKANARLRQRLAGSEVIDALESNYAPHGEQSVERLASVKSRKAGVGRLASVLSDYMAEEGADEGAESLADLLAEIEAEEAMEQQASKFASKKAKKAGQNNPRYFYQEEIESRESKQSESKQSAKKAMFMAEDEYMMADEIESEEEEQADWMAEEHESDEVDPFGLNEDDMMMSEDADPRLASLFSFASEEEADEEEETSTASKKASRFAKAKKSEEEVEETEEEDEEEAEEEEEKPAPAKKPAKKEEKPAKKEEKPAKEEGKASSKKASITPRPKTQQASVKTLGNISRTASDANELSKLWESAPDVSKFFS